MKKSNIPALRFPEFKDCREWEEKTLGDKTVCNLNPPSSPLPAEFIYIDLESVKNGKLSHAKIIKKKIAPSRAQRYLLNGDILFQLVRPYQQNNLLCSFNSKYHYVASTGYAQIRTTIFSDNHFIYQYLHLDTFNKSVMEKCTGSNYPAITTKELGFIHVFLPSLPEQEKIADCLSSLDSSIDAHTKKFDLLKEYKKGLLQKLFPKDEQTIPEYRFPEFKGKGEWEEIEFSKYIKLLRGSSPRPILNFLTQDVLGVNWIKIGDTKVANNYRIKAVEERITQEGARHSRKVYVGELILANSMSFGKTYQLGIDGCIYDGWFVLREYEDYFYKPFLLQVLNSEYMQSQYKKLAAGGIVQNISSEIVYQTNLFYMSKDEQQKIANCLSTLDKKIEAQAEKVQSLKEHKKGLMQQLFPISNES